MRFILFPLFIFFLVSCGSTKKIQKAINKKDTSVMVNIPVIVNGNDESFKLNDTVMMIHNTLNKVNLNQIGYTTFSAKVNVDYKSGDGRNYNVNATVKMYKDSALWISANAILGIEAMRVLITKDSVKFLNRLNKTYTARSVNYLKEVIDLPLDLRTVQDLIIGNAVFLDSNIVSYKIGNNVITLLSLGKWFKNLITLNAYDKALVHSKLDDADRSRNRTADLTYSDYDDKKGVLFSTRRRIIVAEKSRLDIRLEFRQYEFNSGVGFSFPIPKNYARD